MNGKQEQVVNMRDKERVETLLRIGCNECGIRLSHAMALFILSRPGLSETAASHLLSTYIDHRKDRLELETVVKEEADVIEEYVLLMGRRFQSDRLTRFYNHLSYLTIPLQTSTLDVFLQAAVICGEYDLAQTIIKELRNRCEEKTTPERIAWTFLASRMKEDKGGKEKENELTILLEELEKEGDNSLQSPTFLHLLFQITKWKPTWATSDPLHTLLREQAICLDFDHCCRLFDFYTQNGDYANMIHLYQYMKQQQQQQQQPTGGEMDFGGNKKVWKQMKSTVDQLNTSKRSLLRVDCGNEVVLPRPNRKYDEFGGSEELRNLFSVLTKDSITVSVDTIVRGMVEDFCIKSIAGYGTWL